MTTTSTNPTRRAMFGAVATIAAGVVIAPACARVIGTATDSTAWDRAMRRYEAAKLAGDEYDRDHVHPTVPPSLPVGPQRSAAVDRIPNAVWEESGRLCDLMCAYEDELMKLSAPHMRALAWKLERLLGDDVADGFTPGWSVKYVAPTLADVRRFAAREA